MFLGGFLAVLGGFTPKNPPGLGFLGICPGLNPDTLTCSAVDKHFIIGGQRQSICGAGRDELSRVRVGVAVRGDILKHVGRRRVNDVVVVSFTLAACS